MPQFLNSQTYGTSVNLASPSLTGTPTAPTAAPGTNTTQVATTAFVTAAVGGGGAVSSVFGRAGAVVAASGDYAVAQVTGAAPLASPTFTGTPAAPTATVGTNTTQLATCAFVLANAAGGGITNPNPVLKGTTQFQTTGGTNTAYIDGTTGNYVSNRADGSSIFIGNSAAPSAAVSSTLNVFIGYQSGNNTTTNSVNNTAVGTRSLTNTTTACNSNTAVGYGALWCATGTNTVSNNTAVGAGALQNVATNAFGNTALGTSAGGGNTTGSYNTSLGYNAGSSGGPAGQNNTYIGYNATDIDTTSRTGCTAIGANAKVTADHQIMLGTSSESVVVPGMILSVRGVPYAWPTGLPTGVPSGMLQSDGSGTLSWLGDPLAPLATPTIAITGGYTMTSVNFGRMHVCSGTSAGYTVALPSVAGNAGKFIGLIMAAGLTQLVTVARSGSDTGGTGLIDGASSRVMWSKETANLFCDGTTWTKVGGKTVPMFGRLYRSANQTIPASTWTAVSTNIMFADNTGKMADTTNSRLVIARPGQYLLECAVFMDVITSSNTQMQLLQNGAGILTTVCWPCVGNYAGMSGLVPSQCVAGDLITYQTFNNSTSGGTALAGLGSTYILALEQPSW